MVNAVRDAINEVRGKLNQSSNFSYSSRELISYESLAFYWGQNINLSTIFGIPKDLKKKNLVAVNVNIAYLSIIMDIEAPPVDALDDEIYVGTVSFGRKVIVLIESDFKYNDIKSAIADMLDGNNELSEQSKVISANSIFRIVNIGNEHIEINDVNNPLSSVIAYFNKPVTADDFGTPIMFNAFDFNTDGMFENNYKL